MIVVTGAAGLLGNTVVQQLLAEGNTVKALYNNTPLPISHANLTLTKCDILDVVALEETMQNVTQVYHCAGMVSFNPSQEKNLFKINVEGTANVVNAALLAGVKKLVHVSSVAALGRNIVGQPITEKMDWDIETANSKYSHSKYLGELEVWRAAAEGLCVVVVNPSIILGAGNWDEGSTKLFKNVYNEFAYYSTGTTGFVAVKDVANAMVQLMNSNIEGEKFIVSAQNISYQHLFNTIARAFSKKIPTKIVTPFKASLAWRLAKIKSLFTGTSPLITRETAFAALANVQYDNSKLLKALPSFKYSNMDDAIKEICETLAIKNNF